MGFFIVGPVWAGTTGSKEVALPVEGELLRSPSTSTRGLAAASGSIASEMKISLRCRVSRNRTIRMRALSNPGAVLIAAWIASLWLSMTSGIRTAWVRVAVIALG